MEYTPEKKAELVRLALDGGLRSCGDLVAQGMWSAQERQQVDRSILSGLRRQVWAPNEAEHLTSPYHHMLIVLGGPPVAGKSTLRGQLFGQIGVLKRKTIRVVPQELRAQVPEYDVLRNIRRDGQTREALGLSEDDVARLEGLAFDFVRPEITRVTCAAMEKIANSRSPIIVESHLIDPDLMATIVEIVHSRDYLATLLALDVGGASVMQRAQSRQQQTGKRPPTLRYVEECKEAFNTHWPRYRQMFDVAVRLDNSHSPPVVAATSIDGGRAVAGEETAHKREVMMERTLDFLEGRFREAGIAFSRPGGGAGNKRYLDQAPAPAM